MESSTDSNAPSWARWASPHGAPQRRIDHKALECLDGSCERIIGGEIQGMEWEEKHQHTHSNGETIWENVGNENVGNMKHRTMNETCWFPETAIHYSAINMFLLMSLSFLKKKTQEDEGWFLQLLTSKISKTNSHVLTWNDSSLHPCLPCSEMYPPSIPPRLEKPHLQQLNLISRQLMPHFLKSAIFCKEPTIALHQKTWFWMLKPAKFGKLKPQKIYKTWPNWIPYYIWCTNPWRAGTVDWEFPLASFPPLRCQRC